MKSIFTDKVQIPTETALKAALGVTYKSWMEIAGYTNSVMPGLKNEWKYSGEKFGWSFTIRDKKRVIIYLLPRDGFFKTAFVFGQKAMDLIMKSTISTQIKHDLQSAKVYAEGRGIRIEIRDKSNLDDIKQLIQHKINS